MDILPMVGANIRRYRHAVGVSQEEMAHLAGIDRSYASGLERGVRNPTVLILERVATTLGIRAADLLIPPEPPPRALHRRIAAAKTKKAP